MWRKVTPGRHNTMEIILEWMVRLMVWLSRWAEPLSRCGIIPYEKWHPGQKLKLLLVGYNGARNTGADARVVALVGQLMDELGEDNIEITVMTLDPQNIQGYFPASVRLYPFPTFFCWSLLRAASSHHVAILCEGSTHLWKKGIRTASSSCHLSAVVRAISSHPIWTGSASSSTAAGASRWTGW